ncbi:tripartite-type tricarboxylate transporter receptor subunit TctC [Stella humosa]|uniref:Tripartite-type tricarboxylate transporter receptor subunit TctC n=2 Tax=Stella humosa TaxID=94 RepID=A0A3N1L0F0_9PROT|nr:tripartite-type tricarboxylate transporter receptor subunit TctC [Stella humosa]
MKMPHIRVLALALLAMAGTATAQDFPARDLTFIVPYGPGGSTDPISRQFATQMEKELGRSITIQNKPGAAGALGVSQIVAAKPDGYTIGLAPNTTLIFAPMTNKDLTFQSPSDYEPIAKLVSLPYVLVVKADAPWKTLQEFIDDAKKQPGKLRASVSGIRATNDLTMQQLNKAAGIRVRTVPFTGGGGEAMVALLGGRVEAYVGTGASTVGHAQAGSVRVLAVFQKGRYDLFPDATPTADAGYDATLGPGYYAIAPKGVPQAALDRLTAAAKKVIASPEYLKFAADNGYSVENLEPKEIRAEFERDHAMFTELLKFLEQK